jgi:uncharacterized protein YllA (UPF0747 family)
VDRPTREQVNAWLELAKKGYQAPIGEITSEGFLGLAAEVEALREEYESKFAKMLVYAEQLEARLESAAPKSSGQDRDAEVVRAATYASYFALQVQDGSRRWNGQLDDKHFDGYAEEAEYIAEQATKRRPL